MRVLHSGARPGRLSLGTNLSAAGRGGDREQQHQQGSLLLGEQRSEGSQLPLILIYKSEHFYFQSRKTGLMTVTMV